MGPKALENLSFSHMQPVTIFISLLSLIICLLTGASHSFILRTYSGSFPTDQDNFLQINHLLDVSCTIALKMYGAGDRYQDTLNHFY